MKTPNDVNSIFLECTCEGIGQNKWDELMEGSTRANKYNINRIIKNHLPEHYESFGFDIKRLKELSWYNPYNYFKTETHLILVHSSIEYFYRYE